jgi:sugar lactone lactonase YvrE
MKPLNLCHARRSWRLPSAPSRLGRLAAVWALALASAGSLLAATDVQTLTGGPSTFYPKTSAGYVDGDTAAVAQFNTPSGIALDHTGNSLFVADRNNNAIRQLDLITGQTYTFTTQQLDQPVGVAVDGAGKVYVLNRGNGNNGTVLLFDSPALGGDLLATKATGLVNATGIALDAVTNIYVAVQGNTLIRITPANVTSTITTIAHAGAALQGITVKRNGQIAATDAGRHGVYLIDPATGVVTTNAGFHGVGDFTTANNVASSATARFNMPYGVAEAGDGTLVVADNGNHRVKAVLTSGVVTNIYGVNSTYWVQGSAGNGIFPGWWDGSVAVPDTYGTAEARSPVGVVFAPNGTVYTTETHYHLIRQLTGTGLPLPPPPATPAPPPRVGWVDFTVPPAVVVSVLRTGPSPNFNTFTFNNDRTIAIQGIEGMETHFIAGPTPDGVDTVPNPGPTAGSTPPVYRDGMFPNQVPDSIIMPQPDVTVKAINFQSGRPSSSIIQARFIFKAASPVIFGDNAAQFSVESQTVGAQMWYTTDGTDPQPNAPGSTNAGTGIRTISLNITNDMTFKIRAFRDKYQPSEIAMREFSPTNFNANKISFGLTSGEPSSRFLARPGQFFYAPVTLSVLQGAQMYSLQFNVAVTNGLTNPNTGVRPPTIKNGAGINFASMLMSDVEKEVANHNPPPDFGWYLTIPPFLMGTVSNQVGQSLLVNTSNNVLGVGWLYRPAFRYLVTDMNGNSLLDYDTTKHDLITYSIAHDTLFDKADGVVVVGAYSFQVPTNSASGDEYFIQLGSPSATRDGVGAPGADIYIQSPSNERVVTVAAPSYVVGDVAPFRWLNAGDFGEGMLNNSDVMQVFQSAILRMHIPPVNSDLFRAMDSCGRFGVFDPVQNYFIDDGPMGPADVQAMFDGSDPTINCVAFGDDSPSLDSLDICDVFVTFRRSLDPSLAWFSRFWTNGQFVAVQTTNLAFNSLLPTNYVGLCQPADDPISPSMAYPYEQSSVSFTAGDAIASGGQTIQIPVSAKIAGSYPIRVLGLNLKVHPLDGSPALTVPVQFTPNPALGLPSITSSVGNGNYAATWLNNNIAGLTGNATLGTLTVQIPAGAGSSAAYAVHFEHASASPNGLASFPKQTKTGLITLSDRSASSWSDGIPDAWRLRHFGSIHNVLSAATGDADGDGANNYAEFVAGTSPNDNGSVLRVSSGNDPRTIRWPSVEGKRYAVEHSLSLFGGSWSEVSTHDGTGFEMEYQDPGTGGNVHFYRVRVLE